MLLDGSSTASAEPTPAPSSPPNPTNPVFHHQNDALKPNPHPYPIKTTSTGVLTRSNSTTKSTTPYQYYVPQSPGSPSKDSFQQAQNGSKPGRGDKERRGGRHRYSKSLNSDSAPSPLPVPPGFAFGPGSPAGYRPRSGSNSSLSSSASSQGDDVEDADVFGQVADNDMFIAGSEFKSGTMKRLGSTFEPSIVGPGTDPEEGSASGGGSGRRRTYRTIGRRTGGKVRGMVASFERSGDEEEGGNDEDGPAYAYTRRARHRSGSAASDQSTSSSSSSFSTASSGPFPPDVVETKLKPSLYENSTSGLDQGDLGKANSNSGEPTVEQLLVWGDPTSQLHSGTGITVPKADEAALNVETIKLRDVDVEYTHSESDTTFVTTGTGVTAATDNSNTVPTIPDFSSSISGSSIGAGASSAKTTQTFAKMDEGDSTELTVEQLLALTEPGYEGGANDIGAGADAWERVVGSTVKKVDGEAQGKESKVRITTPLPAAPGGESLRVFVNGKSRRGKGSLMAKKDAERERGRRLEDVFVPAGDAKLGGEIVPRAEPGPVPGSPRVISTKELKLEQEMSETREMVRALSARVASVEAKVGEMERVAGELEVRRKKLAEVEMKEDGKHQAEEEQKGGGSVMRSAWLATSVTRTVVGVSRMVGMFQFPFSLSPASVPSDSTTKSKPPSREVSRSRGNNGNGIPLWYKKSWTYYLLFLGLGACAFLLKEVVRKGVSLRGRGLATRG